MAYLTIDEQILINRWAQGLEDDSAVLHIYRQWRERGDNILPHVAELVQRSISVCAFDSDTTELAV